MSFLEDKNKKLDNLNVTNSASTEFSQSALGKPDSGEKSAGFVLDLDKELANDKESVSNVEKPRASAISPTANLPKVRPGVGMVSEGGKISGTEKATLLEENKNIDRTPVPSQTPSGGLSFSLLPVDEEQILYEDFPRALRRILYSFVIGGVVLVGAWFAAGYFLEKYFVEANGLQQQIRTITLEKLKYQTTDADVRLRYQYYKTLQQLLQNHISWRYFFALLEKYTAPEVYFSNFSVNIMSEYNRVMFSAFAQDLKSALKQYMVLKKYASEFCNNVTMSNLTLLKSNNPNEGAGGGGVSFNITFEIKADLFNTSIINSLSKK
ncbi:MAG TPA: hypothetical protein PL066_04055 [bacterium]|nr:hypothetical protein [bacterium]